MSFDAISSALPSHGASSAWPESPLAGLEDGRSEKDKCAIEGDLRTEGFEPSVGMTFKDEQEAYEFYNAYGYMMGFSIRKGVCYRTKSGKITSRRLTCSKAGFKDGKKSVSQSSQQTPTKQVIETRCGCTAAIYLKLEKNGLWVVKSFYKEHNHELICSTPSKKRHLRSHKHISPESMKEIRLLKGHNLGATKIRDIMASKVGGRGDLRYKSKDVSNKITNASRHLIGGDADAMIFYFTKKQESDPEFFFAVEPDENEAIKNIFWIDGRSRRAYHEFGDVVTFDTTYQTNKYTMPFAPFLGVNHHRQTIFFGSALLRDEKATTFGWLFTTWLKAVGGKPPQSIITDQDPAMKIAIQTYLPGTVHRCCQWHVMRKAREHLGLLYGVLQGFQEELFCVIDSSLTVQHFEQNWKQMTSKYHLVENPHLNLMFDKRDEWVPAFFRGVFFANMTTTQRSESLNALLKQWVASTCSLFGFATQFDKMLESIYERESDEDIRNVNEVMQLWSDDPIEVEASKAYTRAVFSIFKEKNKKSLTYRVMELERDKLYEVRPAIPKIKYEWYNPARMVKVDKGLGIVDCECGGFEMEGILCAHSIVVMRHVQMVPFLPSRYVMKRWTKGANANVKRVAQDMQYCGDENNMRLLSLKKHFDEISKLAMTSRSVFDTADAALIEALAKVRKNSDEVSSTAAHTTETSSAKRSLHYLDPPTSQCKGKRKPIRFKHPAEIKNAKNMRTCSYCKKKAGHNARSCPKMKDDAERSEEGPRGDVEDSDDEMYNLSD